MPPTCSANPSSIQTWEGFHVKRIVLLFALWMSLSCVALAQEQDAWGLSKPWKRLEWFYSLRAFPFKDVPAGAWLRAYEQAQQMPIYQANGLQAQALNWEYHGPVSTRQNWLARVNAIAVHPTNRNIIYIGIAKGGVWRSHDGGSTWRNLTDFLAAQYVGCLTLDPVDPNIIYLGTGEEYFGVWTLGGVGIYRSTDSGNTWRLFGSSVFDGQRINEIVIDSANRNKWIVSADRGIYITTDGGSNFILRLRGLASALRMHPTNSNVLWAALGDYAGAGGNGVYRSTDGGTTWTRISALPNGASIGRIELDICRSNPNVVWVIFSHRFVPGVSDGIHSVWKTTDGGAQWTQVTTLTDRSWQTWYNLVMRVDPNNPNIAYAGAIALWRTTDGGKTWTTINPQDTVGHVDQHALAFDPFDSARIYIGSDGGLFYSANRGTTLEPRNSGRGTMEFYAFDVHPTDANQLLAGSQDNGTQLRTDSPTFDVTLAADGMWASYKRTDPRIALGQYQQAVVFRSTNAGRTWKLVLNASGDHPGLWCAPLVNDARTPSRFYLGTNFLYRSTDDGQTWSRISGDLTDGGVLNVIAVAPSNSNVIYTGSTDGVVFVSTDGGATWTRRTDGLPLRAIGGLAVDPNNAGTVYVGFMGFGAQRVVRSTDFGRTWMNISGNLPDTPVNFLIVNPVAPNMLIAATDTGVFVTTDLGRNWARLGLGLPSTPCLHLRANANTGHLYVGTYGRGIWRMPLPTAAFVTTRIEVPWRPGQLGGIVNLRATLQRTDSGAGVAGKRLQFEVDDRAIGIAVTGSDGSATLAYTIPLDAALRGDHTITVTFDGDSTFNSSSGRGVLSVSRARTAVIIRDHAVPYGSTSSLRARLTREDDGRPISGRLLRFSVAGSEVGSATTDADGEAFVSYGAPPLGEYPLSAAFAGDSVYMSSVGNATLSGYVEVEALVNLREYIGPVMNLPADVVIDRDGKLERLKEVLDGKGAFRLRLTGSADLLVKVTHWLRQRVHVKLPGTAQVAFSLINGDVDEDNEVTLFDFGMLVAAFGSGPNDKNWNPNADLDGDEEVTLFDFGILVKNFGLVGAQ
jgi:photosystem II stability/assembly factor-like uncharacterized protein